MPRSIQTRVERFGLRQPSKETKQWYVCRTQAAEFHPKSCHISSTCSHRPNSEDHHKEDSASASLLLKTTLRCTVEVCRRLAMVSAKAVSLPFGCLFDRPRRS